MSVKVKYPRGSIVRHRKTKRRYRVVSDPEICRIEATDTPAYAYELEENHLDQRIWIRPQSEMEDGRFAIVRS